MTTSTSQTCTDVSTCNQAMQAPRHDQHWQLWSWYVYVDSAASSFFSTWERWGSNTDSGHEPSSCSIGLKSEQVHEIGLHPRDSAQQWYKRHHLGTKHVDYKCQCSILQIYATIYICMLYLSQLGSASARVWGPKAHGWNKRDSNWIDYDHALSHYIRTMLMETLTIHTQQYNYCMRHW